jgi:hypothetical protein
MPLVLYWREIFTVTLREEHRLSALSKRVLRIVFQSKRDEGSKGWRKLKNEELNNLHSSPSVIRVMKSRRIKLACYVAPTGRRGRHMGYCWESQKERDH